MRDRIAVLLRLVGRKMALWMRAAKIRDIDYDVVLPHNVDIVKVLSNPDMAFRLTLGFDVAVMPDNRIGIKVNTVYLASDGDNARKFIENSAVEVSREMAALLALTACKQIYTAPVDGYAKSLLNAGESEQVEQPPTRYIN